MNTPDKLHIKREYYAACERQDSGDYEAAFRIFRRLSSAGLPPKARSIMHMKAAEVCRDLGDFSDAIAESNRAVECYPDHFAFRSLGLSYLEADLHDRAICALEKSISLKPSQIAYVYLSCAHLETGNYRMAEGHARSAVDLNAKFDEAHHVLAISLFEQGRHSEAIEEFSEAIRLDNNYAEAHRGIARAYERIGLVNDAKRHFTKYELLVSG